MGMKAGTRQVEVADQVREAFDHAVELPVTRNEQGERCILISVTAPRDTLPYLATKIAGRIGLYGGSRVGLGARCSD